MASNSGSRSRPFDGARNRTAAPASSAEANYQSTTHIPQADNISRPAVDVYAAVASWRSYDRYRETNLRNAASSYQTPSAPTFNPGATAFNPNTYFTRPVAHFTPYQPLRSVQTHKKYPAYRIDKIHRFSNGLQERNQHPESTQLRRNPPRQARNTAARSSQDIPASSIESDLSNLQLAAQQSSLPRRQFPRHSTPQRNVTSPPAPKPTVGYLHQANLKPQRTDVSRRLLIILDLNGTLLFRPQRHGPKKRNFVTRPGTIALLDYLFQNHAVMVYTSARPENAEDMVNKLLTPHQRSDLVAVWARDKLGLTNEQYHAKVQCYKNLDPIWTDPKIGNTGGRAGGRWDQTNTVLVDDSHLKALAQPHNLLHVPEFMAKGWGALPKQQKNKKREEMEQRQETILQSLVVKLEELKWYEDVSGVILRWQTGKMEIPKVPGAGVVVDESVDQTVETITSDLDIIGGQMLTPRSPVDSPGEEDERDDEYEPPEVIGGVVLSDGKNGRVSPIPESTWRELLGENVHSDKRKGTTKGLSTPESLN